MVFGIGFGIEAAIEVGASGEVDFTTDDGFDARLDGFLVKVDRPEEVAVIGDGDGGHSEAGGFFDQRGNSNGTIED